jgi:hypothetical protein
LVLFYTRQRDSTRAKMLYDVLSWLVVPEGQSIAKSVGYVPLPPNVQASAAATLKENAALIATIAKVSDACAPAKTRPQHGSWNELQPDWCRRNSARL